MNESMKQHRSSTLWIAALFLVILTELFFDVVEIAAGKYLLLTNPLRPQVGRLWEEEQKDILAGAEATVVEPAIPDSVYRAVILDYNNLVQVLETQPVIYVEKSNFISFYKRLEPDIAGRIIDPLNLYQLDRDNRWVRTKVSKSATQMNFVFLDGFGRPLTESFVDAVERAGGTTPQQSPLENDPLFRGRVISAETFFEAFDTLGRLHKLQIIGNPYRLIQIKDDLVRVGISRQSLNGSVTIAFEINRAGSVYVEQVKAAELAVAYLVSAVNATGLKKLTMPTAAEGANG